MNPQKQPAKTGAIMKETVTVNIGSMAFTLDKDACQLLKEYLDDIRTTVVRQTIFAVFEYQAHKLAEEGAPLLPSTLC